MTKEEETVGKWYMGGVRVAPETFVEIRSIANRRGEGLSLTVEKALNQYIAADKRKRRTGG